MRIDFYHPQSRLGTSDHVQYYALATTTIFFYDFLLTLGDEVSHVVSVSFAAFIVPAVKGQIRLAGEEIMGYVRRIARRTASVDDLIVFAIFLAVCLPLYQSSFLLEGWRRTGTCRQHTKSGFCIVSGIVIHPCHTRPSFSNSGTAGYGTPFH